MYVGEFSIHKNMDDGDRSRSGGGDMSRSIWETLNVSCLLDVHIEHQVSTVCTEYLDALEY